MLRKVLGLAVVFLMLVVVVATGVLVFEHVRGRRALSSALAAMKERGQDAASVLARLPSGREAGVGEEPLMGSVSNRVARLRMNLVTGPNAMNEVEPGLVVPGPRLARWTEGGRERTWADVDTWAAGHAPYYRLLKEAILHQGPPSLMDLRVAREWPQTAGDMGLYVPAMQMLTMMAMRQAVEGRLDRALVDLKAGAELAGWLEKDPTLLGQLVRMGLVEMQVNRAWAILETRPWSEEELSQLQAVVPAPKLTEGWVHALQGERVWVLRRLPEVKSKELAEWAGSMGPAPDMDEDSGHLGLQQAWFEMVDSLLRSPVGWAVWRFGWRDQALARYVEAMQRTVDRVETVVQARSAVSLGGKDKEGSPTAPWTLDDVLRERLVRNLMGTTETGILQALRRDVMVDLYHTTVALKRYRFREGHYPEDLGALVPGLLSEIPLDRMDGQRLRYRLEEGSGFRLWSVGENLTDDGGNPEPGEDQRAGIWMGGRDWVVPRVATPEEQAAWEAEQERRGAMFRERQEGMGGTRQPGMSPELQRRYGVRPGGE
jgi:hypothetical protein